MRFGTRFLFGLTFFIACLLALVAYDPRLLPWILVVLTVNLLGAAAAVIVTRVFRFPTDGGYRSAVIREELDQNDVDRTEPELNR